MIGSHDAANVIVGAKEKYLAAGFSDYLSKPIKGNKWKIVSSKLWKTGRRKKAQMNLENCRYLSFW